MKKTSIIPLCLVIGVLSGCASPVEIDVQLVNPCNEEVLDEIDFLKFEPRGQGIDSEGLTTIVEVANGSLGEGITIPLTTDFQLVVTGHKGSFDTPIAAIGVSTVIDLTAAEEDKVSIRVPLALVDSFYRTTELASPDSCSELGVTRFGATATYLPDSGTVLIVGGEDRRSDGTFTFSRGVELYDPANGTFQTVAQLQASLARAFHTATLLPDGRVLIAGGETLISDASGSPVRESLKTALIIDPRDTENVKIPDDDIIAMKQPRTGHAAARLADGRVVFVGGRVLNRAAADPRDHSFIADIELFDPDKGLFLIPDDGTGGATLRLQQGRFGHSATLLSTGRDVLVAGGYNETGVVRSMETIRFQGLGGEVVTSSATLGVGAIFHAATLAEDGRVLISGGYDSLDDAEPPGALPRNASNGVEMWEFRDVNANLIRTCNAVLTTGRGHHTVSAIGTSNAVFVGGRGPDGMPLPNAEVVPLTAGANCFATTPKVISMTDARTDHVSAELGSGEVLVVGGRQHTDTSDIFGSSIGSAEVFSPARNP